MDVKYKQFLEAKKNSYNQQLGKLQQLEYDKIANENKLINDKQALADMEAQRIILQKTSDKARDYAKTRLETTMTSALQYIFGPNFSAEIELASPGGKPTAEIYVITDYGNGRRIRTRPQDSRGGGIVDIVSIALRIAMIQLHSDPPINGPIILDEPGKHVSADYSIKLAEFLKFVSVQFNKQIIFVTHNEDLKAIADTTYKVSLVDGVSTITEQLKNDGGDITSA